MTRPLPEFFRVAFPRFCERVAAGRHDEARALLRSSRPEALGPELGNALEKLLYSVEEREARLVDLAAELAALRGAQEKREARLLRENSDLRAGLRKGLKQTATMSGNAAMRALFKQAERVAAVSAPVLITGETGTGKGLLAQYIHYAGPRAGHPLVSLNCSAIPAPLLESELFGIEKGVASGVAERAGHFESASGGALFLDEIGDMPLEFQAKILKALESGNITRVGGRKPLAVDVRLISATHRDLEAACAKGAFRQDLFYRLRVIHLHIPPLRERREDIAPLATYFLQNSATRHGLASLSLSKDSLRLLSAYSWPGNVRELEHEVERAAILAAGPVIQAEDFSPHLLRLLGGAQPQPELKLPPPKPWTEDITRRLREHPDLLESIAKRISAYTMRAASLEQTPAALAALPAQGLSGLESLSAPQSAPSLREAEITLLRQTLLECGNNKTHAAKRLGLSREGLRKKLRRLGLT